MVWPNGERAYNAKLNWDKVDEIRKRIDRGENQRKIAHDYGVHATLITKIKFEDLWKPSKRPKYE